MRPWFSSAGCLVVGAALLLSAVGTGCKKFERKHIPVSSVQELGYPSCPHSTQGPGELLYEGHLRSGPNHIDKDIVERYSVRKRDCLYVATVRQEWPRGTADVEVLYDEKLMPLRIWKRMTLPGLPKAAEKADIRRYELRTDPVTIKHRSQDGHIEYELLKGGHPAAVIGPGRGLLSMWIRRAKLEVGQKVRELVIDVRGLEVITPVTLMREADMVHPVLGPVRVYTIYGREAVFVDAAGNVVGDLAGLVPDRLAQIPAPPPVPLYGPIDPVHTP